MLQHMRTTIRLNEQLLAEAKAYAMTTGRTLTALIEDALRETLARRKKAPERKTVHLKTTGSGGLQSGVDLDDSASLLGLMDQE